MKISTEKLASIFALVLVASLAGPVFSATTYTVTSTEDPEVADPANCTSPGPACTLRDALAAADLDPDHDVVVFDVGDTIYLKQKLIVQSPVTIDGGGTATVRVDQGYVITVLPDRNDNPATPGLCGLLVCPDLPVLQPTYSSEGGSNRPMLEMYGSGSVITGLTLDGSITPNPADLGVERIDFESDGFTDFFLFTIESNPGKYPHRWLVAGGVRLVLPWGTAQIVGNVLRNFNAAAVLVEGSLTEEGAPEFPALEPVVSNNVITGGAAGQPSTAADGIVMYWTVGAEVSDNFVSGFRNGLNAQLFTALSATGNELIENEIGLDLSFGPVFGEEVSLIDGNVMSGNLTYGLSGRLTGFCQISNNDVNSNGSDPEMQGGMLLVTLVASSITSNEVNRNSGFGIVIDGQFIEEHQPDFAAFNSVADNEVNRNGGAGIVILNNSYDNTVEYNESSRNGTGIVTGFGPPPYPYSNTYQWNMFKSNSGYDVVDVDPVCNDTWIANEFGTVAAATGNCIQ